MAEFLLELFSEDIPARMQVRAADDLKRLVTERLAAARLGFDSIQAHSTPRRLMVVVDGLPTAQPTVRDERKGPRVGAPAAAIEGFLKAAGVESLARCEQRDAGKGVFWFAVSERPGRPTAEVLPGLVAECLLALPWPKSMRWGNGAFAWVRPLHSVLAIFDGRPLAGGFYPGAGAGYGDGSGYGGGAGAGGGYGDGSGYGGGAGAGAGDGYGSGEGAGAAAPAVPRLIGPGEEAPAGTLVFGAVTRGHRFLAPEPVTVASFGAYCQALERGKVVLDRERRKARIAEAAAALAAAEGLTVAADDALLEEVAGLVEWPVVLIGSIDQQFMSVPPEVLITSMRTHQKYFATLGPDGALAPRFIVVANMVTADGGQAVVAGNQRVLRARLSDARFFWDQDRKTLLRDRLGALKAIIFHARLGSLFDKVTRVQALCGRLAPLIGGSEPALASHAALLAKTDLVTGMVGEFPELQGVMGRYYALAGGEPAAVAEAIAEHYKPLGPGDRCPSAPLSVVLALADKIDTLVGFFAIAERPTGSKDPYALRRAALGVIRLVLENGLRLHLGQVFAAAYEVYRVPGLAAGPVVVGQLLEFIADRLKVVLRDQGVRHDLIDAVFALGGEDDLVRLLARVSALQGFLGSDDGANLLIAYRRASNIVRIEEKKDARVYEGAPDGALLAAGEERALVEALAHVAAEAGPRLAAEDFAGCMSALARLRTPVDAFFDRVTVNAEDPALRANRLLVLAGIRGALNAVADFSRIEG